LDRLDFDFSGYNSQFANVIWPNDREWCIATDIDWDSTFVAGSRELMDSILASELLEAVPAFVDDHFINDYGGFVVDPNA
jgi:hypothetical protein